MSRKRTVLVLDGATRSALAVVRALRQSGASILVAEKTAKSLAGTSKFASETLISPDPYTNPDGFLEWLDKVRDAREVDVIFPMTDISTYVLATASLGERWDCLLLPGCRDFERAIDKWALIEDGQQLGINSPESILLTPEVCLKDVGDTLGFPIILKPRHSISFVGGQYRRREVALANSLSELASFADAMCLEGDVIAQKFLMGTGVGFFALFANGKCLAKSAHRRVREKPPEGGVSVVSESISYDNSEMIRAELLLKKLSWNGPAMVEYRKNQTGCYLMEINPRYWGSLNLSILSGVNFPLVQVSQLCGMNVPLHEDYKIGVRNRWLLGDLDNLLISLFKRDNTLRQKLLSVKTFLNLGGPFQHWEIVERGDVRPFLHEMREYIRAIFNTG